MKEGYLKNLLLLNVSILFMSTSGILGKGIDLPVPFLIFSRSLLAGIVLFIYCKWKGVFVVPHKKDLPTIILSGVLMAIHWIAYFYALKLSNVAIGMLSLFTYPIITALLEPLILKTKLQKVHLLLGALVLVGIYFLVPAFSFENQYFQAILVGIFSAICYALRNIIAKSKVSSYNGSIIMFYQLIVISILLTPTLFFNDISNLSTEWPNVLLLAFLTTALGHTLFVISFKNFSITTTSILSSSGPVLGILLGILFLSEIPPLTTVIGGTIILSSVVIESVRTYQTG